jgi:hypothetical protein
MITPHVDAHDAGAEPLDDVRDDARIGVERRVVARRSSAGATRRALAVEREERIEI